MKCNNKIKFGYLEYKKVYNSKLKKCKVCNKYLRTDYFDKHIKTKKHIKNSQHATTLTTSNNRINNQGSY